MTFAQPIFLVLLLAVPLLALWEWRRARSRAEGIRFSDVRLAAAMPPSAWVRLRHLPAVLRLTVLTLGVLALARPQVHDVLVEQTTEGIDIMLVFDVSTSMLARDFHPSRLDAAHGVARDFIDGRHSDRIGLVVFAGRAFTHSPLTLDYDFLKRMLDDARPGITDDGTAIGNAIATAVAGLKGSVAESKVIVLLTDGRNNRGEIDPLTAADLARTYGVRIYTVGIGSEGVDAFGRPVPEHLRRLLPDDGVDAESLQQIAERTGGAYFHAGDRAALQRVSEQISELERTEIHEETLVRSQDRFRLFLWPAFLLLLVEVTLANTRLRQIP